MINKITNILFSDRFNKIISIFLIGLFFRIVVSHFSDISLFKDYTSYISLTYHGLMACVVGFMNKLPDINLFMSLYNFGRLLRNFVFGDIVPVDNKLKLKGVIPKKDSHLVPSNRNNNILSCDNKKNNNTKNINNSTDFSDTNRNSDLSTESSRAMVDAIRCDAVIKNSVTNNPNISSKDKLKALDRWDDANRLLKKEKGDSIRDRSDSTPGTIEKQDKLLNSQSRAKHGKSKSLTTLPENNTVGAVCRPDSATLPSNTHTHIYSDSYVNRNISQSNSSTNMSEVLSVKEIIRVKENTPIKENIDTSGPSKKKGRVARLRQFFNKMSQINK